MRAREPGYSAVRVLLVAPSLRRWIGGQEVQADLLARCWHDDPDVVMTFLPTDPMLAAGLQWIERVPALRTTARLPLRLAGLWREVRRVEIVHIFSAAHSSFLITTLPTWWVARLSGRRTLIHYHSGRAKDHLRQSGLARAVLRRTDAIAVPSGYLAGVFGKFGLATRVLPNAIDGDRFSRTQGRPAQTFPVLLCTRNLESHYGIELVIQAFAEVKKVFPSARLLLVGRGSREAALRVLVSTLNVSDVEFAGPIPRGRIADYYHRADIFVNASLVDNMPVSILEAFASGLPVISTATGGIPHFVEHERTGLLSDPGDFMALARNVCRVLRDEALATRLSENGHREALRYEWRAIRGDWLKLYRSLLGQDV